MTAAPFGPDTYIGTANRGEGHANVTGGIWTNSGIFVVGGFQWPGHPFNQWRLGVGGRLCPNWQGALPEAPPIQLSGTSGNRGTLYTNRIVDAATVNGTVTFDGGILKARSNQSDFISNYSTGEIIFDSGGAFIDSNGFDIGIDSHLSGTGGLNKLGAGTLTLTRTNNYAGSTVVNNGTLKLNGSVSTPSSETIIGNASGDNGTLQFSGGTLTNTNARVGNAAGSQGSATVTSGTWDNSGTLWIGYSGTGSLLVDGGTVGGSLHRTRLYRNHRERQRDRHQRLLDKFRRPRGRPRRSRKPDCEWQRIGHRGWHHPHRQFRRSDGFHHPLRQQRQPWHFIHQQSGEDRRHGFRNLRRRHSQRPRVDETDFLSSYESGEVTINSGGAFIDSNGHNIGISTALGGTGGLTKRGPGTLTLSGTSAYTGGTTVSDGTLSLGHATNTLANDGAVTISGGTLALGANSTPSVPSPFQAAASPASGGTLAASGYAFTDSGSVSANLSGSGALTKTGAGPVALSGSNTYSGGTTVSGGTLPGTTSSLQGNIANNAALIFQRDTSGTFSGDISGSGTLTKLGVGTVTLSDSNTYSGRTTISGGTLSLGHATNTLADNGAVTVSGGTLALGANSDTVGALSPFQAAASPVPAARSRPPATLSPTRVPFPQISLAPVHSPRRAKAPSPSPAPIPTLAARPSLPARCRAPPQPYEATSPTAPPSSSIKTPPEPSWETSRAAALSPSREPAPSSSQAPIPTQAALWSTPAH